MSRFLDEGVEKLLGVMATVVTGAGVLGAILAKHWAHKSSQKRNSDDYLWKRIDKLEEENSKLRDINVRLHEDKSDSQAKLMLLKNKLGEAWHNLEDLKRDSSGGSEKGRYNDEDT